MSFSLKKSVINRRTWLLVLVFILCALVYVAMMDLFIFMFDYFYYAYSINYWEHKVGFHQLIWPSIIFFLILILISAIRIIDLRNQGGIAVAKSFNATPIDGNVTDPNYRRLRNVVEEMAISSGVPVPLIFVLKREKGINAFAAGYSYTDAVLVVTQGALDYLNRNELQGVIAHEFSHILNRDIAININLIGVLYAITYFDKLGTQIIFQNWSSNSKDVTPGLMTILIGIPLKLFGFIGLFMSSVAKAAVSRQREELADINAVRLTRSPDGLFNALLKVYGVMNVPAVNDPAASEVSHMLFTEHSFMFNFMASHPPLIKRLQLINPRLSTSELIKLGRQWENRFPDGMEEDRAMFMSGGGVCNASDNTTLIDGMPESLKQAARNQFAICPMLCALLFSKDTATLNMQRDLFLKEYGKALLNSADLFFEEIKKMNVRFRLSLAALCFPALRMLSRDKLDKLTSVIHSLINIDGKVELYEYCLSLMLTTQINDLIHPGHIDDADNLQLREVMNEASLLLSVVAQAGQANPQDAMHCFEEAMASISSDAKVAYQTVTSYSGTLDQIWPRLNRLDEANKKILVNAMIKAVLHDNVVNDAEAELISTVSAVLHYPLPLDFIKTYNITN